MIYFETKNILITAVMIGRYFIKTIPTLICMLLITSQVLIAQSHKSSPSNWIFPNGNPQSTRKVDLMSVEQKLDSFRLKWTSPLISGDVQPLIGNLVNNGKIFDDFKYAPNEIVAVVGDNLVILSGNGRLIAKKSFSKGIMGIVPRGIKSASCLFDTNQREISNNIGDNLVIGLETMEYFNAQDTLAFAYIAGYSEQEKDITFLKRMAIDLRPFRPNFSASIKPIYGQKQEDDYIIYATVNMSQPIVDNPAFVLPPFFRGLAMFNTGDNFASYPLPDAGDDLDSRITVGPEVQQTAPSFGLIGEGKTGILLPSYPTPGFSHQIKNPKSIPTSSDRPYLMGFNIGNKSLEEGFASRDYSAVIDPTATRPLISSYYVQLNDANSSDSLFILVAEQYSGIDGSKGLSQLHLHRATKDGLEIPGDPITSPNNPLSPPFKGNTNHYWSVAVGDVDGHEDNKFEPYFPNNKGNELIVTQSSRDFAFASSTLSILRYKSGTPLPKPPPGKNLYPFDTIATARINGWIAAVNDLDGAPNNKDEIVLVDGSKIMIVGLRDYNSIEFRTGRAFDTLYTYQVPQQTISSVCIADLEGDEKNDLIITTYDKTYVIGSILSKTIKMISPVEKVDPPVEFCAGDSATVSWENVIRSSELITLKYQPTKNKIAEGTPILIKEDIDNKHDTVHYKLLPTANIIGTTGYFFLEFPNSNGKKADSTAIISFNFPTVAFDPFQQTEFRAGDIIAFKGTASCTDSLILQYSEDKTNWINFCEADDCTIQIGSDKKFSINRKLPCVNFYRCSSKDLDSIIYVRMYSYRAKFEYATPAVPIKLLPAKFPVEFEKPTHACPSIIFNWDLNNIDYACDTISFSISADKGSTFSYETSFPKTDGKYIWNVPLSLPDSVLIRFCCENSCIRIDTLVKDFKPKYIDIVAPNPVRPPSEILRVVYQVPVATEVTIKIFDQGNNLVAIPVRNKARQAGTAYCDTWDGTRSNGSPVANGMYYICLELSNGNKEIYPVFVRK